MLKGYRGIVCALIGLALSGAAPPKKEAVTQQAVSRLSTTASSLPDSTPYPDRCYSDKNHGTADLCAQWRATIAAEKTTDTAYWSNWIAGGGALLSFVSIVLVVIALGHTRKANEITRSGQRAWMTDADPNITERIDDTIPGQHYQNALGFNHTWENTGSTPAIGARCLTTISIVAWDAKPSHHVFPEPPDKTRTIGPGKKGAGTVRMLSGPQTQSFRAQQCKVFVYSRIEYFDIFDRKALRVSEVCHEAFVPGGSINDDPQPNVAFRIVGSQNTLT